MSHTGVAFDISRHCVCSWCCGVVHCAPVGVQTALVGVQTALETLLMVGFDVLRFHLSRVQLDPCSIPDRQKRTNAAL